MDSKTLPQSPPTSQPHCIGVSLSQMLWGQACPEAQKGAGLPQDHHSLLSRVAEPGEMELTLLL